MFLWGRKTKSFVCVEEDTCVWEDVMRITKHRWLKCVYVCVRVCVYVCVPVSRNDAESMRHMRILTTHMRILTTHMRILTTHMRILTIQSLYT